MRLPFLRKKSAAPGAGPRLPAGIPSWATPLFDDSGSYAGQVQAAFLANPVAARAIRMVTESAGGAPITSDVAGHPALALLHSCGFGASGPGLLETLAGHMLLHGNAYVDVAVGSDGLPAALFALRPERVSIEVDGEGWPAAHVYRAGSAVRRYPVATAEGGGLLHIRSFHPTDDHHGAGCLGAASTAVAVHNAATRWNKALLDNAARPSGALVYQPGDGSTLSPDQFARLKTEMEAAFAGAANAGRPMLLEGGLSWQALSLSPAEMDFAGMREAAARDIALALGVPPLLLELLAQHCPPDWAQRDAGGALGLTGWSPPSALLSPCQLAAQSWLRAVTTTVMGLAVTAGIAPAFQVGEPWWWVGPNNRPCLYDAATTARWQAERGSPPPLMNDIRGAKSVAEQVYLDWCGERLAEATAGMVDAARSAAAAVVTHLLFYTPQVLLADRPDLARANMPVAWAWPAFDVLQLEDYTFVTSANQAGQTRGRAFVEAQLFYPRSRQHYLAGFVLSQNDAEVQWPLVADAAAAASALGVAETFVWAWPQVARDGFTPFQIDDAEDAMAGFHDVRFPLELGFGAAGGPAFSTQVVVTASGAEQRNAEWSDARLEYDAGLGIRSEDDLKRLVGFFRARRGQAHGFRFLDPLDNSSATDGAEPTAFDQRIGTGDGGATRFALIKSYGDAALPDETPQTRRVTRSWPESVVVAVAGVVQPSGWTLAQGGQIDFDAAPPAGAAVTAGFRFDVPVRFATDRIEVSIAGWRAGELPSVPLIEIRED